jgi:hypothetical protein
MVVLCLLLQVGECLFVCVVYWTSLAVTYFTVCERQRDTERDDTKYQVGCLVEI